ncbi:MAG: hypothetical protein QOG59_949, partial [Solirubrobacteraceae bacterium]|nr:hypothetical protein [Solirubrobacteraceae bacterium]
SEDWVAVTRGAAAPAPVSLLVLLDRRPGSEAPQVSDELSPAALITHCLDSGRRPERQVQRLEILGRVARSTPIVRLQAGTEVGADALAHSLAELTETRGA